MIDGIAHICFTVGNLDASMDFYIYKLGLKHAFDFKNEAGVRFGVYLKIGKREFVELYEGKLEERAPGQSYAHICLEVSDIEQTITNLRARGITVSNAEMGGDNAWQAWLADPDGNKIELHQYTPTSWQAAWLT